MKAASLKVRGGKGKIYELVLNARKDGTGKPWVGCSCLGFRYRRDCPHMRSFKDFAEKVREAGEVPELRFLVDEKKQKRIEAAHKRWDTIKRNKQVQGQVSEILSKATKDEILSELKASPVLKEVVKELVEAVA